LRKRFDRFELKNVTFTLPAGYIMGLIGPNGAGKTTTIKLILNLLARDAGAIRVFGRNVLTEEVAVKSRIGFVHDEPAFYGYLTAPAMGRIVAPFYPTWDAKRFDSLCREFELPRGKRIMSYSRGMKMKLALALALSHDADLIILDEPTSGLDPVFRRELLERLAAIIQDERKAVLFSTHITSDLERVADYLTFIRDGEIAFSTTRDEIMDGWAIVKGDPMLLTEETRPLFLGLRETPCAFTGLTADRAAVLERLNGAVCERPTFDDLVFFMGKEERRG
jgi:ABC-2 type transport system ATP-binding protein